ncbi:Uma2 family endonuclease [Picosynechococcus sp. PCC 73109]|uniref:Uma2 family endonuclease n=1 Tax=Picosynechococcus sp. PCC 73109 TaxID=374982 RepID=UPI0007458090|nr:Uma2 family endonuclease [Picosynechococcus sp. PCC 73109]AMA09370.1 hypothetical protein AWQ23_08600 [Picosynechococcus sp. PCC 73109]
MTVATSRPVLTESQSLILPGRYSWEEFQAIQTAIGQAASLRITYLDGVIELMTLGEYHESIKTIIGFLVELYLFSQGIEFYPVGSAPRVSREKSVSFEPDESYYLGEQKEHPDLAIEVNVTSGSPQKLEKYQRLGIQEVWLWQAEKFSIYVLEENTYQALPKSKLLPDLDFELLAKCVLMSSRLDAIQTFTAQYPQK